MSDYYVEYNTVLDSLMSRLGIRTVDWLYGLEIEIPDEYAYEINNMVLSIMKYLNGELVCLGSDAEIKDKLDKTFEISSYGAEKIVIGDTLGLYREVVLGMVPNDEEPTCETLCRFSYLWGDFFGSLCTRLRIQYASLLVDEITQGCPCCCPPGENYKTWESYVSGVNPNDEDYGDTGLESGNTNTNKGNCACCSR